jgi:hypothetical protein
VRVAVAGRASGRRALEDILDGRRCLAPEVVRAWRGGEALVTRRQIKGHKLLLGSDPVTGEPHDVAGARGVGAPFLGVRTFVFHALQPFPASKWR